MRTITTLLAALTLGCAHVEEAPTPFVDFLDPLDGDTVTVGDVPVALLVEDFTLLQAMLHHSEGAPEGNVVVRVDGVDVARTGDTNLTVPVATAGQVTLEAELVYEDGDALEPPVKASIVVTAVEAAR